MGSTKPVVRHDRKERFASTYPESESFLRWLRKEVVEEVLDPEIPIVDCHHHYLAPSEPFHAYINALGAPG